MQPATQQNENPGLLQKPAEVHGGVCNSDEGSDYSIGCLSGRTPNHDNEGFGFVVGGVPVGDEEFVSGSLNSKTVEIEEGIKKITKTLQTISPQGLMAMCTYCIQPLLQYWMQTLHPDVVRPFTERLDTAILQLTCDATGFDGRTGQLDDPEYLTIRRMRLPTCLRGMFLRSQTDVSHAAYLGALLKVLPMLPDIHNSSGVQVQRGFAPALALRLLGDNAMDFGNESTRFSFLVNESNTDIGRQFKQEWTLLQSEIKGERAELPLSTVGDSSAVPGILTQPIESAGIVSGAPADKPQSLITRHIESVRFKRLFLQFKEIPVNDPSEDLLVKRDAFFEWDPLGLQSRFIGSLPTMKQFIEPAELNEAYHRYLGLPSPCCRAHVGKKIGNTNRYIDKFGKNLECAILTGDGWRTRHDGFKWLLYGLMQDASIDVVCEVLSLFTAEISTQNDLDRFFEDTNARQRQGMIPDFLVRIQGKRPLLLDVKGMGYSKAYDRCRIASKPARGLEPVSARARAVDTDMHRTSRDIDAEYNNTAAGVTGPVEAILNRYPRVEGLVVGAFGECSPAVHKLIGSIVEHTTAKSWRLMGCSSPVEAKSIVTNKIRREVGIAATKGIARLKLDRIQEVINPMAASARDCRKSAQGYYRQMQWETYRAFHPVGEATSF
jgi:hypothetical protein